MPVHTAPITDRDLLLLRQRRAYLFIRQIDYDFGILCWSVIKYIGTDSFGRCFASSRIIDQNEKGRPEDGVLTSVVNMDAENSHVFQESLSNSPK